MQDPRDTGKTKKGGEENKVEKRRQGEGPCNWERRRRNVGQKFRRSCSVASALLQVPGAGYQDGFLSDCREEPERRENRNKGSLREEKSSGHREAHNSS